MNTENPITIALIAACPFPWPRGTPIRAYRIAESLAQLGHSVHVMTYHLGEDSHGQHPFHIHRIDDRPSYRKTTAGPSIGKLFHLNPALIRLTRQIAQRVDFDVVHAIHLEGLLIAHRALPDLPLIYDAHTSLSGELPDYFRFVPRKLVQSVGGFLDRLLPARADYAVSVSDSLGDQLVQNVFDDERRVFVIPNGVEFETFNQHVANHDSRHQIIFTGNDAPYQDLDLLLDAFELLLRELPDAKLTLSGAAEFKRERVWVAERKLDANVDVRTTTFSEELRLLADAQIAVSPRTVCDGVPQKLLNYMAAGKAIVASQGSGELLKQHVTGIRVDNNDAFAMAQALRYLIENPETAQRLGNSAKAEVLAERSWQAVATRIEDVFRLALSER